MMHGCLSVRLYLLDLFVYVQKKFLPHCLDPIFVWLIYVYMARKEWRREKDWEHLIYVQSLVTRHVRKPSSRPCAC